MSISEFDISCLRRATELALEAEGQQNLPIGAVISLDGEIIAEGQNAIWFPEFSPHRHAEMEALCNVPDHLWERTRDMTLYTTLEPCLMCMGAILLHRVGRIIFGSADDYGGAGVAIGHLPPYFEERLSETEWLGPACPEECDPLYGRVQSLERMRALANHKLEPSSSRSTDLSSKKAP
jgi:tRNA(adenine34) deaminase